MKQQIVVVLEPEDIVSCEAMKAIQNEGQANHSNLNSNSLKEVDKIWRWKCEKLCHFSESVTNPFRAIKHIIYDKLRLIHFDENKLETLEPISRLKAPLLQQLILSKQHLPQPFSNHSPQSDLSQPNQINYFEQKSIINFYLYLPFIQVRNNISSIDTLPKLFSKNIKLIVLYLNKLQQGHQLAKGNFPQLQQIKFDVHFNHVEIQSVRFLSKISFSIRKKPNVLVSSVYRINERLALRSISKNKKVNIKSSRQAFYSK